MIGTLQTLVPSHPLQPLVYRLNERRSVDDNSCSQVERELWPFHYLKGVFLSWHVIPAYYCVPIYSESLLALCELTEARPC